MFLVPHPVFKCYFLWKLNKLLNSFDMLVYYHVTHFKGKVNTLSIYIVLFTCLVSLRRHHHHYAIVYLHFQPGQKNNTCSNPL